ncbi:hypothetical protein DFH29DRAFT_972832 [Suillus ampliporus]|nr:hypothetical protein DFH29DRAFT_972832 [Suillus ampliporus]
MHDGPLKIRDIVRTHLHDPEFAFLSACHTTVGDESSPMKRFILLRRCNSPDSALQARSSLFLYANLVDDSGRLNCKRAVKTLRRRFLLNSRSYSHMRLV